MYSMFLPCTACMYCVSFPQPPPPPPEAPPPLSIPAPANMSANIDVIRALPDIAANAANPTAAIDPAAHNAPPKPKPPFLRPATPAKSAIMKQT
ncbi:hypothetical protein GE061_015479 [Apolygus lucorum]|uniref:Uncharacterized protein n=1 Tax=Apolygus lucorum TaxID=248454 RepID=A0A6A4J8L4_APOLU|nr:hypothetical protein GE061_015479 [Apolygus lucorum]